MSIDTTIQATRVFDPLPEVTQTFDCVIHVSTFLETYGKRRQGTVHAYFDAAQTTIETLCTLPFSRNVQSVALIVSVNGLITEMPYIKYLQALVPRKNQRVQIYPVVFQRPNVGWQWGGFWDVWLRYKRCGCKWWFTLEGDVKLTLPFWFDLFTRDITTAKNAGNMIAFVGAHQAKDTLPSPYEYYGVLPKGVWRDWENKPLENAQIEDLRHTSGEFYFCTYEFLQAMDATYHGFTAAFGGHYELDGVIHGEVGFSQKAHAMGFTYIPFKGAHVHLIHTMKSVEV